jgi:hypothetical protein
MRNKREQESNQRRNDRLTKKAQERRDDAFAEDIALDVAVRRSIKEFGA